MVVTFLLLLWAGLAQALSPPCEGITGILGCIECMKATKACMLCHKDRWPAYNAVKIAACKAAATTGSTCRTASGDKECSRCDSAGWCYQCNANKYFDSAYNCKPDGAATVKATCKQVSKNAQCAACNPDNTCRLCDTSKLVVPMSATYINIPGSQSQCLTAAQVKAEALDLMGAAPSLPSLCREVTPDFKCASCVSGYTLTITNKCVKYGVTGDGACGQASTLPYRQYCSKCGKNARGNWVCKQCTWGRKPDASGACSINCKALWGIGCLDCTATACTRTDPVFASGR